MSSTGVRETNSNERRVIKGLIKNEEAFIQSLRVFANTSTLSGLGSTGGEVNNSPLEASGIALTKSGDFMLGQFGNAFDGVSATNLASDTLDVSKTSGVTFPVVILQGEGLADDDLVTIIQGEDVFPFQELIIRTRVNVITVKNSDNVNTPDGNDLVLPVGSIIHLYFDTFLGEWVIDGGTPFFGTGGFSGNLSDLVIDVNKDWQALGISNVGKITGVPEIEFTGDNNHAIISDSSGIRQEIDALEAHKFITNGVPIGAFDNPSAGINLLDMFSHDIINTGDILPGAGSHEVGDSTDFYNQMHSQFFVPEAATVITNRYGLAKTGNALYVNFDNTNVDAGFGIFEEGLQRFFFSRFGTTPFVNEFFIGGDPFLALS